MSDIRAQMPLALSDDTEPEPDVAVVPLGDDSLAHPTTALLVVEVADSSLKKARTIKAKLYAAAGISEYWLVDLTERAIEVHTQPSNDGYQNVRRYAGAEVLSPTAFPDVEVRVSAVVPLT